MPTSATSGFEAAKSEISEKFEQGKQTATEALHDARDEIVQKVGEYTEEAKDALLKGAAGTQRDLSSSLLAFGRALRAASDHLAFSDHRTASKFILDAAGGMERMSSSLKNKPFEDVLEEVRSFGRDNSGALIAGSVLAGLALGRFVKSSSPSTRSTTSDDSAGAAGRESPSPDLGAENEMEAGRDSPDEGLAADRGATP